MIFLPADFDLEAARADLSRRLQRPVYVASCLHDNGGAVYRQPGSKVYKKIPALELFLSRWTDHGTCVRREGSVFSFDLFPCDLVKICFPVKKDEIVDKEIFRTVSLPWGTAEEKSTVLVGESVSLDLGPFRSSYKLVRAGSIRMRDAIVFSCSDWIEAPKEHRPNWHLGQVLHPKPDCDIYPLQTPGWYSGREIVNLEDINRLAVVDTVPGCCAVCRGTSGSRRHLGVWGRGPDPYIAMHICETCLPMTFEQILSMVKGGNQ